jgi:uncharacterized protein (DUF433 family)
MKRAVISRNPDVMGGTPVFCGTRVPVQTLLDYLEAGESIDEFLAGFPGVTREQVIEFLQAAKDRLVDSVACGFSSTSALTGDSRATSSDTKS